MNPEVAQAVTSVLDLAGRVCAAAVARSKVAAAPTQTPVSPACPPEAVKAAADSLVANGWVVPEAHAQAIVALSEPGSALNVLQNLAEKAAAEARKNRLSVGQSVDGPTTKAASAPVGTDPYGPSEADQQFLSRMTSIRRA